MDKLKNLTKKQKIFVVIGIIVVVGFIANWMGV